MKILLQDGRKYLYKELESKIQEGLYLSYNKVNQPIKTFICFEPTLSNE
jgi:hypothetical protein